MTEEQAQTAQPSAEDMQKANTVAMAGATAAQAAENPEQAKADARTAMQDEAQKQGLELSDEQIDQICSQFVDKVIEQFEARGAFDAPPEPVAPPATVSEPAVAAEPQTTTPEAPPRKKSFAERFLGE